MMKNILLPLVYLGNGHYSGQTPPPMDNSLTAGETVLAVAIVLIVVYVIGKKIISIL